MAHDVTGYTTDARDRPHGAAAARAARVGPPPTGTMRRRVGNFSCSLSHSLSSLSLRAGGGTLLVPRDSDGRVVLGEALPVEPQLKSQVRGADYCPNFVRAIVPARAAREQGPRPPLLLHRLQLAVPHPREVGADRAELFRSSCRCLRATLVTCFFRSSSVVHMLRAWVGQVGVRLTIVHAHWKELPFAVRYHYDGVPVPYGAPLCYLLVKGRYYWKVRIYVVALCVYMLSQRDQFPKFKVHLRLHTFLISQSIWLMA